MTSKTSSNNGSAAGSANFINDSSHYGSLNTFRSSPSVNVGRSQSNVRTEGSFYRQHWPTKFCREYKGSV